MYVINPHFMTNHVGRGPVNHPLFLKEAKTDHQNNALPLYGVNSKLTFQHFFSAMALVYIVLADQHCDR